MSNNDFRMFENFGRSPVRQRRDVRGILLIPAIMMIGACAAGKAKVDGAVFDIPVYQPAKLTGSIGSTSGGDGFVVSGMGWFYKTDDKPEKVIAFYKNKLPSASKEENGDGETVFHWVPKGAEEHEYVEIFIKKDGEFTIHEDVLPNKRKD